MAFASYVLFAGVVSKLGTLVRELDRRVDERTAAYEREIVERRRLDEEIAQVADRERRRLGHDLHDKLGQHLTGTALAAQVLKEKLAARRSPETSDAEKLVNCLEEGIDFTRNLARGFFSPELRAEGLVVALQNLAEAIGEQSGINCVLHGDELIPIHASARALIGFGMGFAQKRAASTASQASIRACFTSGVRARFGIGTPKNTFQHTA